MSDSLEDKLRQLVAYPTVSGNTAANRELLNYVADFVGSRGMHVAWHEFNGYESLVATTKPGDKTPKVMLAAHADVVPAPPQSFKLRKGNGYYHGRGVLDMKFALAAYLQIIDNIQESLQDYDLGLMVTSEEELGGWHGAAELIKQGYKPHICLIPDGGENWQIQTFAKGIYVMDYVARGTSAHGSRHWQGDNAIQRLLRVYDEMSALFPADQNAETNTCTMTRIRAGKALTQVPNKATMTVDIRIISQAEYRRIRQAIEAICKKHKIKVEGEVISPPTEFDLKHPLIEPYARLIEEIVGIKVTGARTLGQNDGRFFAQAGVPCISLYPTGSDLHNDHERLAIPALQQFFDVTQRYVQQVADRGAATSKKPQRQLTNAA